MKSFRENSINQIKEILKQPNLLKRRNSKSKLFLEEYYRSYVSVLQPDGQDKTVYLKNIWRTKVFRVATDTYLCFGFQSEDEFLACMQCPLNTMHGLSATKVIIETPYVSWISVKNNIVSRLSGNLYTL